MTAGKSHVLRAALILSSIMMLNAPDLLGQRPPRPVTVTTTVNLAFGAFYQGGSGGTVVVNTSNVRSSTGDVVLFGGSGAASAVFRIQGNAGTLVTLLIGPDVPLTGSGGGTMMLHIGPTNPVSPFVLTGITPVTLDMSVGGSLTVGIPASNPPGSYSGTFTIVFNQN